MSRDSGRILETMAAQFLEDHLPPDGNLYSLSSLVLESMMLSMAARDLNDAADNLINENRDIQALLSAADSLIKEQNLKAALEAAHALEAEDFKLDTLRAINNQLMSVLIDLHEAVEQREDEDSRKLNRQIWQLLGQHSERNMLPWFGS